MGYALASLLRNLRAGARLAFFTRVDRLAFRFDVVQVVLLFAVSALIDVGGDFLRAIPPREFMVEGLASELYSGALLMLMAALVALICRQRQMAMSVTIVVLSALPVIQVLHYVPSWPGAGAALHAWIDVIEYVVVVWIVLVLVRCVAVAMSPPASFQWLRAIVGGLVLATPIWIGSALMPSVPWWRGATDDSPSTPSSPELSAGSEAVLAAQSYLLDNMLDKLADERAGDTDLYFIGFSPPRQEANREDAEAAQHVMDTRFGTDGRSIVLANDAKTLLTAPFATVTNLRETLDEIGAIVDEDEDVVMLYLTSTTARNNQLAAEQPPLRLVELGPAGLKQLLDSAGIRWRIIVVSACYSGGFVEPLADDYTLVITSTDADHPGFGCDGRTPSNLFGDTFFQQGLAKGNSFEASFEAAKARVAAREREAGYAPSSHPQWSLGAEMAGKLKTLRKHGASGTTVLRATPKAQG